MTQTRLPAAMRRRVIAEAHDRCAYCHTTTSVTGAQLVIDHILPEAAKTRNKKALVAKCIECVCFTN